MVGSKPEATGGGLGEVHGVWATVPRGEAAVRLSVATMLHHQALVTAGTQGVVQCATHPLGHISARSAYCASTGGCSNLLSHINQAGANLLVALWQGTGSCGCYLSAASGRD